MRIRFTTFSLLEPDGPIEDRKRTCCTHYPGGGKPRTRLSLGRLDFWRIRSGSPVHPCFCLDAPSRAGKRPTVRIYVAEIASVCISYYLRAIAVESLISVCFSSSLDRRSLSQRYRGLVGAHAWEHIAGGWNNPGPYPGIRARAPVRGAARRAARERRTAVAHAPQEPGRTACRSGSARPAARSPGTSPRTTG